MFLVYFINTIPACRLPAGRQGRQVLCFNKITSLKHQLQGIKH
jgi:hypothetical protein